VDKIRGCVLKEGSASKWRGKMDQVVAALFPPKTYAYIPKSVVTYCSKQKYLLKLTAPWGIQVRLINTNYDVKPDEMDQVASLVCARPPDKWGVPLHMVAASSKEWCEGVPSFSSTAIGAEPDEDAKEEKDDGYEILYDVLKLGSKETRDIVKDLFHRYGLGANLILNSFDSHETFLKWEADNEKGGGKPQQNDFAGIKKRGSTTTSKATKKEAPQLASFRQPADVCALQVIWQRWQALTNVEKHLMDLQTHLAMEDDDEALYALRNVLEINPALSEPILKLVRMDPFCLHDMLPRSFPLTKCLAIAKRVGMERHHPFHVIRLISEAIAEEEADGHSFATYDEATMFHGDIKQRCNKTAKNILSGAWTPEDAYPGPITIRMPTRLSKSQASTGEAVSTDVSSATVARTIGRVKDGFVVDATGSEARVYRRPTFDAQASYLKFLREQVGVDPDPVCDMAIEAAIHDFQDRESLVLTKEQRDAVVCAVRNPLTVIIGEAGSGKTTVLKAILDILSSLRLKAKGVGDAGKNIVCVAPTGKAARVFNSKTGWPASTIDSLLVRLRHAESVHGFLGLGEGEDASWHPIVVVDEMSMVTLRHTTCFEKLATMAKAAGNAGLDRVVLLGDLSQLAPIGPGDVFHDTVQILHAMHEGGLAPHAEVIVLKGSQRVDPSASLIYENSRLLRSDRKRRGIEDTDTVEAFPRLETTSFSQAKGTFEIVDTSYDQIDDKIMRDCYKVWKEEAKTGWGQGMTPQPLAALQILTDTNAKRKDINKKVQAMVQESAACAAAVELSKGEFAYLYDKVMVCDNAMEFGVVNGDIGWIMQIPRQDQVRLVLEGGKQVLVNTSLVRLTLAYAITVHKSQGSEFPFVMVVFYKKFRHTTRDLLYTALSRGRKRVKVISGYGAFDKAVATQKPERQSDAFRLFFLDKKDTGGLSDEDVLSGDEAVLSGDEAVLSDEDETSDGNHEKTQAILAMVSQSIKEPPLVARDAVSDDDDDAYFSDPPLVILPRKKPRSTVEEPPVKRVKEPKIVKGKTHKKKSK